MFNKFRGHEKSLHYPENAKQLPTGYLIIITIDVGHHQTHKMWKGAFSNKANTTSKPFHSVGTIKLVQRHSYWEKAGTSYHI